MYYPDKNIMADNGFSLFDVLPFVRRVYLTCDSIANSKTTTTKVSNTSGIAKVRIKVEKVNTVRH